MIKILLINDFYLGGGAEGVFRDTYQLLQKSNMEVEVFYGEDKACFPKSAISYFYNLNIKKKLAEKLEDFKPSVIHIHNYYHYLSPSIFTTIKQYKKHNKVKVVFTAHDYHLICPSSGMTAFKANKIIPLKPSKNIFAKTFFRSLDYRGFKFSMVKKIYWFFAFKFFKVNNLIDQIISPSYFLKDVFENSGIKIPIVVVRNPMNLETQPDLESLKTPLNKEIRILFIGRLSQEKGLEQFLQAFGQIKNGNVYLDILGTGPLEDKLKQIVLANNLKNVVFHGFQQGEILKDFLIKSNVLLLPSVWYENAPLSIIEGAAYSNVILTRNLGGMAELAKLTQNYILINDWKQELEVAIDKLTYFEINSLKDDKVFSPNTYINKLLKIYQS